MARSSVKDEAQYEAIRRRGASTIGIDGRSSMNKGSLINALRTH